MKYLTTIIALLLSSSLQASILTLNFEDNTYLNIDTEIIVSGTISDYFNTVSSIDRPKEFLIPGTHTAIRYQETHTGFSYIEVYRYADLSMESFGWTFLMNGNREGVSITDVLTEAIELDVTFETLYRNSNTPSLNIDLNTISTSFLVDGIAYNDQLSEVPVPAAFWLFGSAIIGFSRFSTKEGNGSKL